MEYSILLIHQLKVDPIYGRLGDNLPVPLILEIEMRYALIEPGIG